ncbi:MAG: futalosine hydrolase [Chitinophagales bacterium]
MKILFVSATYLEIAPFLQFLGKTQKKRQSFYELQYGEFQIDVLITGVGIIHTTFQLGRLLLQKSYKLAINVGIAGSFNHQIKTGQVFRVQSEVFGDMGVEDNEVFIPLNEMDFFDKNQFPYQNGRLFSSHNPLFSAFENLKTVSAITVNRVSGKKSSIEEAKKLFNPDIESMEGAAFFYCCMVSNQPFIELRAISNYVEVRNKSNWQISLAVENLNQLLIEMVNG